jgi:hypothetical protein
MTLRVTTLRSKQYGEYLLSAINYSGGSIKNREYLTEFEAKFEKSLKTEKVAWEESISKKLGGKKSRWTVPLSNKNFKIYVPQKMSWEYILLCTYK